MIASLLLLLSAIPAQVAAEPPPLTAEQLTKVRELVQRTQSVQAKLKTELAASQEQLARCYAEYQLDEPQVARLQAEILEQQKQLLASHHRLQTELRSIVGAERFQILSRRIENALRSSLKPAEKQSDKPAAK
ncbi:hypothetical protein ETAA8_20970 [Anatilimnocola aggregata]|uniref:Periplasmic heavy metal sensor n=1 Tax=Anatilimnocola aggregata TaxID=2528021 RepID=A0A517Y9V1_9BACT|nr:hypothetical protein [Anatilimnocola aggregata]QDU27013.1 hypothetical protein ETAA8_20970 [Anatilimnocola aggregata]